MFYFAVTGCEPGADFFGLVVERPHAAAIGDVAGFVNYVQTFGPGRVRRFRRVAHVIDTERHRVFKALDEIVGDVQALLEIFWLGVADVVFHVGLHLPLIGGMRFAHVDGEEIGVLFVIFVNLRDVANLAAKRRSGKTAEYQNERLSAGAFANVKTIGAIQGHEARVRGVISDF